LGKTMTVSCFPSLVQFFFERKGRHSLLPSFNIVRVRIARREDSISLLYLWLFLQGGFRFRRLNGARSSFRWRFYVGGDRGSSLFRSKH
ncbi:hypothetical protein VIGAN_03232200, partial [Vigna angularis var. angularis]